MFTLVALLFLVTNGVQAEKPSMALKGDQTFASEKECKNFLGSKKGEPTKKAIETAIAEQKGKLAISFVCVKTSVKNDDNTI